MFKMLRKRKLKKRFFKSNKIEITIKDYTMSLSFKDFIKAVESEKYNCNVNDFFYEITKIYLKKTQDAKTINSFYNHLVGDNKKVDSCSDLYFKEKNELFIEDISRVFAKEFKSACPQLSALKMDSIYHFINNVIPSINDIEEIDSRESFL